MGTTQTVYVLYMYVCFHSNVMYLCKARKEIQHQFILFMVVAIKTQYDDVMKIA